MSGGRMLFILAANADQTADPNAQGFYRIVDFVEMAVGVVGSIIVLGILLAILLSILGAGHASYTGIKRRVKGRAQELEQWRREHEKNRKP